jgi:hypothetical protein
MRVGNCRGLATKLSERVGPKGLVQITPAPHTTGNAGPRLRFGGLGISRSGLHGFRGFRPPPKARAL